MAQVIAPPTSGNSIAGTPGGANLNATATSLAQHILTLQPDKEAARLCFYHYLKNLCEAGEPVTSDLVNRFLCRALSFAHWQENKMALFQETMGLLHHFQETHQGVLPLDEVFRPDDIQVVVVENIRTLELIVHKHHERISTPYDQFRVFADGNDRVIAIVLQGDRSVRVSVYPKAIAIREGELVPLHQELKLFYTPELHLHPQALHQMEIGPHACARFRMTPEGIVGSFIRGYTFQKYGAMEGGGLHRYPALFYPLKRLEQLFVDRKSDPMYVELTGLLEKALELLAEGHPESRKFAKAAQERGRLALEHIFPDDKVVRLLIENLEKSLALELARQPESRPEPHPHEQSFDEDGSLKDEPWPKIRNMPV